MDNNESAAERRQFRMHRDLLWSVIRSQAGSISKAILELVMNSCDAKSTRVDIELDSTHLRVVDDGSGFGGIDDIKAFFETFGTPHASGDAKFGRFRMGRGQVMAFTKNVWVSGDYSMAVDIKSMGLEYDLRRIDSPFRGCRIDGELYDPLKPSELIRLIDELRELCKYAPIPVIVNGERISQDLSSVKWTAEDDDAYYLVRDSARTMEIFNQGVSVRQYWNGEFGVCGIVVTKRALEVNFARNDILVGQCEVFKRISARLKEFAKKDSDDKPRNNEAHREFALAKLLTGNFESEDEFAEAVMSSKVVTDYAGKHYSIEGLWRAAAEQNLAVAVAESYSSRADRVQQTKMAIVISPKTMARARHMRFDEMLRRVESNLSAFSKSSRRVQYMVERIAGLRGSIEDLDVIGALIDDSRRIVEPKEYSKDERLVMSVLNRMNWVISRATGSIEIRRLGVVESESLDGMTDGRSMIFLNRKLLKIRGAAGSAFQAFDELKMLMVHEYLHKEDDSRGHGHPAEFYERFHDVVSNERVLQTFVADAVMLYLATKKKAGTKLRAGDLKSLDMLLVESEEAPDYAGTSDWQGSRDSDAGETAGEKDSDSPTDDVKRTLALAED